MKYPLIKEKIRYITLIIQAVVFNTQKNAYWYCIEIQECLLASQEYFLKT
jgi:hypothetical protein